VRSGRYTTGAGDNYDIRRGRDLSFKSVEFIGARATQDWKRGRKVSVGVDIIYGSVIGTALDLRGKPKIGILSFSNPHSPRHCGPKTQEASILLSSTLRRSLLLKQAKPFYYNNTRNKGWHTNMMIYSPSVVIFCGPNGEPCKPLEVAVLSCCPPNRRIINPRSRKEVEEVRQELYRRMGRILYIFERKGRSHLILGAFGCGGCSIPVKDAAHAWAKLLHLRFKHSFEAVVFAIADQEMYRIFKTEFSSYWRSLGSGTDYPRAYLPRRISDPRLSQSRMGMERKIAVAARIVDRGAYKGRDGRIHDLTDLINTCSRFTVLVPETYTDPWTRRRPAKITMLNCSTVAAIIRYASSHTPTKTGVLNFASSIKPGGGWRTGAQAQEESIARASTLCLLLETRQASRFYTERGSKPGMNTHKMIGAIVIVFMDDEGRFIPPKVVYVISCAAVDVRNVMAGDRRYIDSEMEDRMGRILYEFERRGMKIIILGSFGTGVYNNSVDKVARSWARLLSSRFRYSFDEVVFAILDRQTFTTFRESFNSEYSGSTHRDLRHRHGYLSPSSKVRYPVSVLTKSHFVIDPILGW
jgi:uncharacterized protein (TIGR02452 family)